MWYVWSEEFGADALLLFRSWLFSSRSCLQDTNAQKHVNPQFWSQKAALLVADCSVKTISVLIKIILSIPGITVRVMCYDLGVVALTVSSVRISVSEIWLHLEKPFFNNLSSVLNNSFYFSLFPCLCDHLSKLLKIISQFKHLSHVRILEVWHLEVWPVKITYSAEVSC